MLGRILVVDDDPWIQRSAAHALGQRGYQVSLAGDPAGAFAVASKIHPDLVVTSVALPAIQGWPWWERLRAIPACAHTPIVFLLPMLDAASEIHGAGPRDKRLRKPFRLEDLERTIVSCLEDAPVPTLQSGPSSAAGVHEPGPAPPPKASRGYRPLSAFRGALDQISLSSVLTILEMERKSGVLLVDREESAGRLFLRKGRVIRADTERPRMSGAAAVYETLGWARGSFDFLAGDVGDVDEIQTSTTFLLIEGARRLDEANERRRAQGNKL